MELLTVNELMKRMNGWRLQSNRIVFTNGCFDILHEGHVSYLAEAKKLGNRLIVGLNTDASVKRQEKGDDRPVNHEESRAKVLSALRAVDAVVLFDEDTPLNLITTLQPDVLVKGADYDAGETDATEPRYIVGANEVKKYGGAVMTIPLVKGVSTTNTIRKLKSVNGQG